MYNIYDNGALMIGNIKDIISYIENDNNLETWEYEELLKELKELEDIASIVMVNYDNPMGYTIDYWTKNDIVEQKEKRHCTECGEEMTEGYCIESGLEYYCSDECLHKNISEEEYERLYDNGNGDSYWTQWEE